MHQSIKNIIMSIRARLMKKTAVVYVQANERYAIQRDVLRRDLRQGRDERRL